jgi:hypothetical protein
MESLEPDRHQQCPDKSHRRREHTALSPPARMFQLDILRRQQKQKLRQFRLRIFGIHQKQNQMLLFLLGKIRKVWSDQNPRLNGQVGTLRRYRLQQKTIQGHTAGKIRVDLCGTCPLDK